MFYLARVTISFMWIQQLEFIPSRRASIKFMLLMTANGFPLLDICTAGDSVPNAKIFQFSILFYRVVEVVSLVKSLPPSADIFLLGRNFLRPCKLKAVINHRLAGQSFIREPFELLELSWAIKSAAERFRGTERTLETSRISTHMTCPKCTHCVRCME